MPALLRHPVARLLATTAVAGSTADWVLFATLVVTVDGILAGTAWATALVLLTRIVPGVLFAPLAARRIDRADLRTNLVRFEVVRVGAVAALATAAATRSLLVAAVALGTLEFASAMQAAGREAITSRHVPRPLFVPLNTVTAVLSYGLLPVGAALVAWSGPGLGWVLALTGYTVMAVRYLGMRIPVADHAAAVAASSAPTRTTPTSTPGGAWLRVTIAAALGLVPAVTLFTVAPDLAGLWLADRTATFALYGLVLAGGAAGFVLANVVRPPAPVGMVVAFTGTLLAAAGWWQTGLVVLGVGAGSAYLDLQHRLQSAATDPSQFATAFAVLKVTAGVAVLAAPAMASASSLPATLTIVAFAPAAGAFVAAPSGRLMQLAVREMLGVLLRLVVRIEVTNPHGRIDGPAVVVSNHPHWIDGAVAVQADRSLRPIARWQPHLGARFAIWAGNAVVTTAGTGHDPRPAYMQAADHLGAGGRIWLAPEGGSHQHLRLRAPRSGAVRMAHAAGVPIQPLAIEHEAGDGTLPGRWRPWRRPVVRVCWGPVVHTTGDVSTDNDRMMTCLSRVSGLAWPPTEITAADAA